MADDMKQRREIARRAFVARRGDLGLTQEEVARRGDIVARTVQNFEAGKWPHPRSRAKLERAVGWPLGQIERLATEPEPELDPVLLDLASRLNDEQAEALIRFLRQVRDEGPHQKAANG